MAGASSGGTVTLASSLLKGVYNPKAFFPHAASLRQASAHCARFSTAASRRSLGRVSVPVWLIELSLQLPVIALVSRYLTNELIGRETILDRRSVCSTDHAIRGGHPVLATVSRGYPGVQGRFLTCYSPVRRFPPPRRVVSSLDLHVLGAPPAFVLSQDQTLRCVIDDHLESRCSAPYMGPVRRATHEVWSVVTGTQEPVRREASAPGTVPVSRFTT